MKSPTQWLATYTGKPRRWPQGRKARALALARGFMFTIHTYTIGGVPDCYGSVPKRGGARAPRQSKAAFKASMTDNWMDLPWDDSRDISIDFILSDPDCAVVMDNVREVFGYDLRTDLARGRSDSPWMKRHA